MTEFRWGRRMGETNKGGFLKEKLCQLLFSSEETKAQRQEKKKTTWHEVTKQETGRVVLNIYT
jgi:hypothetical protein